jgi:hypothetical protein
MQCWAREQKGDEERNDLGMNGWLGLNKPLWAQVECGISAQAYVVAWALAKRCALLGSRLFSLLGGRWARAWPRAARAARPHSAATRASTSGKGSLAVGVAVHTRKLGQNGQLHNKVHTFGFLFFEKLIWFIFDIFELNFDANLCTFLSNDNFV